MLALASARCHRKKLKTGACAAKNYAIMNVQNPLSSYTTFGRLLGGLFIFKANVFH